MAVRVTVSFDPDTRVVTAAYDDGGGDPVGAQVYDPESGTFIFEGPWTTSGNSLLIELPPEKGIYHIYVSPIASGERWQYGEGKPFLLIKSTVENGRLLAATPQVTTLPRLRRRKRLDRLRSVATRPFEVLTKNRGLIRSLVRRDILARYRGSFGDVAWTVLHPLLLMATYFFVFGVVLRSRLGEDTSRSGYALFFLAGMLPWLAFSEAIGRSPHSIVEHRNFVKKLVFPVEVVPVVQTVAGLVTGLFATVLFVVALAVVRGAVPASVASLPLILIPQAMFTVGLAWLLSALGVFFRDLTQIMGFVLTLLFFLTPICYPESALPPAVADILTASPIYGFVRGYRQLLLEGIVPQTWMLWAWSAAAFFGGYAVFAKLRRSFADVI